MVTTSHVVETDHEDVGAEAADAALGADRPRDPFDVEINGMTMRVTPQGSSVEQFPDADPDG
jgi:hypothetical protein